MNAFLRIHSEDGPLNAYKENTEDNLIKNIGEQTGLLTFASFSFT